VEVRVTDIIRLCLATSLRSREETAISKRRGGKLQREAGDEDSFEITRPSSIKTERCTVKEKEKDRNREGVPFLTPDYTVRPKGGGPKPGRLYRLLRKLKMEHRKKPSSSGNMVLPPTRRAAEW